MYQEVRALFIYCLTPVHMGAGTSFGAIDSPIQRERHTNHPHMAGSGLKGAIRHYLQSHWEDNLVARLFGPGPEQTASEYAGAVAFSDAQLVAFPVRSLKSSFVYATCPLALGRARRSLALAGFTDPWPDLSVRPGQALVGDANLLTDGRLVLEAFEFKASQSQPLGEVSQWLSEHALPAGEAYGYFRDKLMEHLVVVSDDEFGYFVESSTVVEPHVRINDVTGTADDGGLFYVENLPPESLLLTLSMATQERREGGIPAEQVASQLQEGLQGRTVQFGGDATTGRGLCALTFWGGN